MDRDDNAKRWQCNKDSIFPASEWNYNDTATFCKGFFGVEPRPNWITAEFGGHVSASFSIACYIGGTRNNIA
jgi:hypothetical protein